MKYLFVFVLIVYCFQIGVCHEKKALPSQFSDSSLDQKPLLQSEAITSQNINTECQQDWRYLLDQNKSFRRQVDSIMLYLQHPVDVMATPWPESFQDCLDLLIDKSVGERTTPIVGQYCFTYFLPPTTDQYSYEERLLGTGDFPILSQVEDIYNFGLCVPSTCSSQDVKMVFEQLVKEVKWNVTIKVPSNFCQTKQTQPKATTVTYYVWLVLFIVCVLVIVGTAIDSWIIWREQSISIPVHQSNGYMVKNGTVANGNGAYYTNGKKKLQSNGTSRSYAVEALRCFSVYSNGHDLFSIEVSEGSVDTLHGLRFISLLGMIIAHTLNTSIPFTFRNNDSMRHANKIIIQMVQNTGLFNDTFFFISGFLAALVHLKKMKANGGHLGIISFYWYRWMRITPPYAFFIAFNVGVLVLASSGPRWPHFVMEVENCKQNWWLNMLYINNFFGTENMCSLHFWYLATVMQLHLIAPLLLYALYRYPRFGIFLAFCCLAASNITHAALTYFHDLPPAPLILNHLPGEKLRQYLVDVHFPFYIKLGSYALGMVVGRWVLLYGHTLKMRPIVAFITWPIAVVTGLGIAIFALGRYFYPEEIHPSIFEAVLYAGTSRIIWDCCLTFYIVTHHIGRGGIVTKFLSWSFFKPLSRLTYCAYIIHYSILLTFYASRPGLMDFSQWIAWIYFSSTVITSFLLAIPLSLGFELPAMRLAKLIEKRHSRR